ncbi:unnamed protein product [Bursaphelenchus okinawaensis]|uniref:Transcription factor AP-2 C-terminal domain-containing protein n=1 Tax=Bursaphelenchus okinawaensis TaxID=465554 RepID=A0A811LPC9_9BILA|nr:unnamed protein product [Bursaphelenchus okinawaensis]CAG9127556.1 unnamed protein product [Bursaphelenchus okinawaensis]
MENFNWAMYSQGQFPQYSNSNPLSMVNPYYNFPQLASQFPGFGSALNSSLNSTPSTNSSFSHNSTLCSPNMNTLKMESDSSGYYSSPERASATVYPQSLVPLTPTSYTADYEDDKEMVTGEHLIAGRMGLLNENKQYVVKLDELVRRLDLPENLNISYLNAILRRAKGQRHANRLRSILKRHGVPVAPNKRIQNKATCFTALCEEESLTLAGDLGTILDDKFDKPAFHNELVTQCQNNLFELTETIKQFQAALSQDVENKGTTRNSLEPFKKMFEVMGRTTLQAFEKDRTFEYQKTGDVPQNADPLQQSFWDTNLMTHNFGIHAMMSTVSTITGAKGPLPDLTAPCHQPPAIKQEP